MAADTALKRLSVIQLAQPWCGPAYPAGASAGQRAANLRLYAVGGAAAVTVPDVVGASQAAGTATLTGDGFVVSVQNAYSGVVPAGDIISQSPTAGSSAESGSTVIIVVSVGAAPATGEALRNGRQRGIVMPLFGRG